VKLVSLCCLAFFCVNASLRLSRYLVVKLWLLDFYFSVFGSEYVIGAFKNNFSGFFIFLTQSSLELVPETRNADVPKQFSLFALRNIIASVLFSAQVKLSSPIYRVLAHILVIRIIVTFCSYFSFL